MDDEAFGAAVGPQSGYAIVELRQYSLQPQQRDVLIELFERTFIESQEEAGMWVLDHFRDLDNPDRFVWLRGFSDMAGRADALDAFYTGPIWLAHRETANATMIDSDNVLLLRPTRPSARLSAGRLRPPIGAAEGPGCLVTATICRIDPATEADFVVFFEREVAPELTDAGATILATYVTEPSANNYPRLPIREGEHVFVWLSRFPDLAAHERHRATLAQSPRWSGEIAPACADRTVGTPEVLRLVPTARSPLRA